MLLAACAPLNTATMSEPCRYQYNACLSRCPTASANPAGDTLATVEQQQRAQEVTLVSNCTQACNEQAKSCK